MYTLLYAFYIGAVCTLYSMHSMHVHMHMLPRAWRGAPLQYPSTVVEYLRTAAPLYLSSTSAAPLRHLCASAVPLQLCGTSAAPLHLCTSACRVPRTGERSSWRRSCSSPSRTRPSSPSTGGQQTWSRRWPSSLTPNPNPNLDPDPTHPTPTPTQTRLQP